MKVHTLNIDSSERDTSVYAYANSYVVNLDNPIYDISNIKLVSARIPTPQLMTCATNKTFKVDGVSITLNETNYSNGYVLATDLDIELAPANTHIDSVIFDEETDSLVFSNTEASDDFTLQFYSGTSGYLSNASPLTTPHQLMGFSSKDFTSTGNVLRSGAINLDGPNSLILKLTTGSDEFTQTVYTSTPFYTGHILLDGTDFVNFSGTDDKLVHHFHSGAQKMIKDVKIEFFYMSHGRLIPYDFRNQDHILKFEISGSTDKLENLPKVPIEEPKKVEKEEPIISIPEIVKNTYKWRKEYLYIGLIVLVGLLLLFFMKAKPISGLSRRRAARA
jgi:type 1 fimbria pilin